MSKQAGKQKDLLELLKQVFVILLMITYTKFTPPEWLDEYGDDVMY